MTSSKLLKDNGSPKVAIIILNYQGADDTLACLASLNSLAYPHSQVFVVDNASNDDSAEKITQAYPEMTFIQSETNLGYSGGNNLGIQAALNDPEYEYIWLLNNDTEVEPETLTHLITTAGHFPNALIGGVIFYPDGRFQRVGNRISPFLGGIRDYTESEISEGRPIQSITGCSMLVPRSVFETIGLLDASYFLYFEDNDFCLRAAKGGLKCLPCLKAKIFHKEGASTGKNTALVTYYYQRNRLILLQRFQSPLAFKCVEYYTAYRLFRSKIKSQRQNTLDAKRHHQAFELAVKDFYQGVTGKCPHQL